MEKKLPELIEEWNNLLRKDIEITSEKEEINSLELDKAILKINMGALALSLTILSFLQNRNLIELGLLKWSWILLSCNLIFITLGYKFAIKEWGMIRKKLRQLLGKPIPNVKFETSIYGKFSKFFDNLGLLVLYFGCGFLILFAWKNITHAQKTSTAIIPPPPAVILTEQNKKRVSLGI